MLLADAVDHIPPGFAWNWVLMGGMALSLGLQVLERLSPRDRHIAPQPLSVREDHECASRKELEALRSAIGGEINALHSKIGGSERGTRAHADGRIDALTAKVDELAQSQARVEASAETHTTQLASLDATLKEILRELPRRT